jgi:hypothetical protein
VLGALASAACALAYAVIIALHGPPYWIGWWVVMLAVLVAAFFAGRALAAAFEWIIAGYREPG